MTRQQEGEPFSVRLGWAIGPLAALGAVATAFLQPALIPTMAVATKWALPVVGGGALWRLVNNPRYQQTYSDLACGTLINGVPDCGKTSWVQHQVQHDLAPRGIGGCIASPKGLDDRWLGRFPADRIEDIDLISPYSDHPRGFNLMQTHGETEIQRENDCELISSLVAEIFARENSSQGKVMAGIIKSAAYALLQWGMRRKKPVTLVDLHRLLRDSELQQTVFRYAHPIARDIFERSAEDAKALARAQRDVATLIGNDTMCLTLCDTSSGVDLVQAMRKNRWVLLDVPQEQVTGAALLCRLLADLVQIQTPYRPKLHQGAKPWMAVFDEIQEYPTLAFKQGLAMGREYGLAWCMIHHSRAAQLTGEHQALQGALGMCQNKYYFQLLAEDADYAHKATSRRWEPADFTNQEKRHYRAIRRVNNGRIQFFEGTTPELAPHDQSVADSIRKRNAQGPARRDLVAKLHEQLRGC